MIIGLAGCTSSKISKLNKDPFLIREGMSKEEVHRILGNPDDRQFKEGQEAWMYCATDALSTNIKFYVIWFNQDNVSALTSYNKDCSYFNSLNWRTKMLNEDWRPPHHPH